MLDQPAVRGTAMSLRRELIDAKYLPESAVALQAGEALLMRPLLLHASSNATRPRVLHIVYHSGAPVAEPWHRELRN